MQESAVRRKPTTATVQGKPLSAGATGSNDSSTATLTPSIITIQSKYSASGQGTTSGLMNAVTSICGSNGGCSTSTYTTISSGGGSSKRKYSPVPATDAYQCDPLQRSSTEIIL
ncbi:Hypothetical predicted protein [Drosophila guanche]|uniref:Uncharacterized protein n=2 Tax=Drosophila guanche TaxID=7266 RepID=A0A3B0JCN6_DROGU|nr:Hypothetical predicted protein [Drosophila guanche]